MTRCAVFVFSALIFIPSNFCHHSINSFNFYGNAILIVIKHQFYDTDAPHLFCNNLYIKTSKLYLPAGISKRFCAIFSQ